MARYGKCGVYEFLSKKNVDFEKMEHEAVHTMEDMQKAGICEKGMVFKNLFLRDAKGKTHYLVSIPEEKAVDLKKLAEQIGSTKLSFASAERLEKYLSVSQGCVSPFGILNDENHEVIVVFDKAVSEEEKVGVHPNDNTATVWLKFADICTIAKELGNKIVFADFA